MNVLHNSRFTFPTWPSALLLLALVHCGSADNAAPSAGNGSLGQLAAVPCPPVNAPVPQGPSGTIATPTPSFSWTAVPGATSYTLYVLRVSDEAIVLRQTGITTTSFTPTSALPFDVQLRWKVKGESSCGAGPYSPSTYYTVAAAAPCPPVNAPVPQGPSGTIATPTPSFSWTAVPGAASYTLYVLRVSDEAIVLRQTGLTATTFQPSRPLPTGVDLRWKVKGESSCGAGPYSPSTYFAVNSASPAIDFGYYGVDSIKYGNLTDEVKSYTNLVYIGGYNAGLSETPADERKSNLAAIIARDATAGMHIMLDIELGGPLTVGDVLMAAQDHWDMVKYVILADEMNVTAGEANIEIDALHRRIRNLGLDDSKPVGVTLTADVALQSDIVNAKWDFINIEAYTEPCDCQSCGAPTAAAEIQAVKDRTTRIKARIAPSKFLALVVQGYDRNGAFTNMPVLAELNRATYFDMAKGDSRVRAVVIFDYSRKGNQCATGSSFGFGTRGHPELQNVHKEIWADINGG